VFNYLTFCLSLRSRSHLGCMLSEEHYPPRQQTKSVNSKQFSDMRFSLVLLLAPAALALMAEPVSNSQLDILTDRAAAACSANGCKCDTSHNRNPQGQFCGGCHCKLPTSLSCYLSFIRQLREWLPQPVAPGHFFHTQPAPLRFLSSTKKNCLRKVLILHV